jgi:hypothetical protein
MKSLRPLPRAKISSFALRRAHSRYIHPKRQLEKRKMGMGGEERLALTFHCHHRSYWRRNLRGLAQGGSHLGAEFVAVG